ncbi:peroxisomal biogenesis factor 11 [Galdieria sulphuraria]|uniref:Peroxisomal biogenesis factor 11 n=1 Tax=Galdieria sulphuraria TaxID=130081 RepID=M2XP25_GALSU|nr:peroxisomal biogenesis factor 11 [Galdieria sulphuraria]EME31917.1 peroxisomal biogenesis factor 11 [Galdieria sulphuraria]|eukprot:XP_005708437.1 peroxisomal biogenesis factor 11 [Galdieria sulphuraria]
MAEMKLMTIDSSETWKILLSQTEGRDKLYRTLQYACKLVRGVDAGSSSLSKKSLALEQILGNARQVLRLAKWVNIWSKRIGQTSFGLKGQNSIGATLQLLNDLGNFLYFAFDNYALLCKTILDGRDANAYQLRGKRFFLLAVIAGFLDSLWKFRNVRKQLSLLYERERSTMLETSSSDKRDSGNTSRELQTLQKQQQEAIVGIVRYGFDIVVGISISRKEQLSPTLTGFCGVISSLVAWYQVWPRKPVTTV